MPYYLDNLALSIDREWIEGNGRETEAIVNRFTGGVRRKLPRATRDDLDWGTPNFGGPLVTGGGIVFIAATMDNRFRAIRLTDGEELWSDALPAGGQASPMTYAVRGKQYVVIAAGGHAMLGTNIGDYVVAYALPD